MPFNRLNHSILGELRPRFALKSNFSPDDAIQHLQRAIEADPTVTGVQSNQLFFLRIPEKEQHYWSPEMTVRIEIEEYTDYTTIACLIGPKQSVWALWAMIYTAILLLTVFSGIFGYADYNLHGSSGWLWLVPIGIVGLSSAFLASKFGQKRGRNQMLHLVSFLYHNLSQIGDLDRLER